MSEKKNLLPPGWECKYDENNGKCYYINHITKALQLQDPRPGYVQLRNDSIESIPLQPMHGSPYHVYPVNNFTAVKAFQGPHSSIQSISGSPLMSTISQTTMETPLLRTYDSPNTTRLDSIGNNRRKSIPMQETSFTNQIDTNTVVSKIQTMFPTAGENHIRLLLKKYMKNIFPKADETLLLDVLANSDNNVQKASERLIAMGYNKRDVQILPNPQKKESQIVTEEIIPLRPKELSEEEKETIKVHLQEKYPKITERIVSMALESVSYSEDRAIQILQIVQQEDDDLAKKEASSQEKKIIDKNIEKGNITIKQRNSSSSSNDVEKEAIYQKEFQSILGKISTLGHNKEFVNGPDESLLLADYVTWSGANPNLSVMNRIKTKGPDTNNLKNDRVATHGSNSDLCKGPQNGLAKGSIYATLNPNIKCN